MLLRFDHLPEQRLIEPASIAIWGRNKIIVALAFSVWIINISFLTQGKSPSSPLPAHDKVILNQRGSLSGIVRVNNQSSNILELLGLFTHRSGLDGILSKTSA